MILLEELLQRYIHSLPNTAPTGDRYNLALWHTRQELERIMKATSALESNIVYQTGEDK